MINRTLFTLTTTAIITVVQPALTQEEASSYASVYRGDRNQKVIIVPIEEKDAVYIKVSGVEHPIDNVVFEAIAVPAEIEGKDYKIQYEGQEKVIFLTRKRYGSYEIAELFLPGEGKAGNLAYDSTASAEIRPLHIQTEYLQQQESETQTKHRSLNYEPTRNYR